MKVKDIMSTKVTSASPDNTITEVAKIMQKDNIGSLPVCEDDELVGIITDRDIVIRNVANNIRPDSATVKEVMTASVTSVTPDMDVSAVSDMMANHQIRRVPVVEKNKLVGIVALKDLAVNRKTNMEASDALTEICKNY